MKSPRNAMRWISALVSLTLLALLVMWLAGFFTEKVEPESVAPPAAEVPPLTWEAARGGIEPQFERAPGTIVARREATVSARITAVIAAVNARAADAVQRGQTLIELDSRDLAARERQADQAIAAAQARLGEAEKQYARMQALAADGTIPRSQYDSAQADRDAARAELERAQSAAAESRAGRSYATLTAPFDGRIVDRLAEPGDTAMPGQPLLKMYDPTQLRLEAYVRESLAGSLRPGQTVGVQIDALGDALEGRVEEVVPQAEPGSRSVLVKVALPEDPSLFPGMFGRLVIPSGEAERLYAPAAAVHRVGQLTWVWTLEPATDDAATTRAVRRYVKLGDREKEGWTEILSGLTSGAPVGVPAE
jgi:RND family efflux transporter MFP subunit